VQHWGQQARWPLPKTSARSVAKGAERAVTQLDRMVGDFIDQHMDG